MTKLRVSYSVIEERDETVEVSAAIDDIGESDVIDALQDIYPFGEIVSGSVDWEVVE